MARCTGGTVVLESPTIPTYTEESETAAAFETERGALTIHVDPVSICECGEEIAITLVLYNGEFLYDGDAIYSGTLAS